MRGCLELFSQEMSDLCPLSQVSLCLAVLKGFGSFQPTFNKPKALCPLHYESHALPVKRKLHLYTKK